MGNRQRIIDAAIELMNDKGSAVGTTLLAEHLSISPGNLYYHFRNREEILGEILEYLSRDLDTIFMLEPDELITPKKIASCFIGGAYVLWRYRFFFSSSSEIILNDQALSARYREIYIQGMDHISNVLTTLNQQSPGGLPLQGADIDRLTKNIWVVWTGWSKFTEVLIGKHPSQEAVLSCHEQLAFLWKPYINESFYDSVLLGARKLLKQPELIPGYEEGFHDR